MSDGVKFIIVNDEIIYQGDYVVATVSESFEDDEGNEIDHTTDVIGRIHMSDKESDNGLTAHVCQHMFDGESIGNKYGYPFSWHLRINPTTGEITTGDTSALRKAKYEEVIEHIKESNHYLREGELPAVSEDDDPMPVDWKYEDRLPF